MSNISGRTFVACNHTPRLTHFYLPLYILLDSCTILLTSMASTPVNCSSSAPASCCSSSQLFDEKVGAAEATGGVAGATPRPMGSSNIWARSAGSGGGAASCAVGAVGGAVGGAAGAPNGAARVGGGAGVAVLPGSGPESSEEQEGWHEYAEEVALSEEELAVLTCAPPLTGPPMLLPNGSLPTPPQALRLPR